MHGKQFTVEILGRSSSDRRRMTPRFQGADETPLSDLGVDDFEASRQTTYGGIPERSR